jgi:hypothetical protein
MIQMTDINEFAQQFYQANPALVSRPIEDAVSEIEKALKSVQKTMRERLAQAEAIKAHGATHLHAIYNELEMNEVPTSALFPDYHMRQAFGSATKGKAPVMPTKEERAAAEKQLREVLFDGVTFKLVPAKGARPETVWRLKDETGADTGAVPPEASGGSDTEAGLVKLVSFVKSNPGLKSSAIMKGIGLTAADKGEWNKLIRNALARELISTKGNKAGTTYHAKK